MAGYGEQHALKERYGTREARLRSRRPAKTDRISRRRKREEHSGSPRGP